MARQTKRKRENGQALVEFAFTLPILLLFTAGIFDFGRVFFVYAQASNQMRRAVREAPVVGYSSGTPSYLDCQNMIDVASRVIGADETPKVYVYYFDVEDAPLPLDPANSTGRVGICDYTGVDNPPADTDLANGDILKIISVTEVTPVMMAFINMSFTFELEGQRTIVKTFELGAKNCAILYPPTNPDNTEKGKDADYDGLCDDWEMRTQCTLDFIATDNPTLVNGCNLGCQERETPYAPPPNCVP